MKSKLLQNEKQKAFVIVFETGDEVKNGLLEFAKQNKINSGFFTAKRANGSNVARRQHHALSRRA